MVFGEAKVSAVFRNVNRDDAGIFPRHKIIVLEGDGLIAGDQEKAINRRVRADRSVCELPDCVPGNTRATYVLR